MSVSETPPYPSGARCASCHQAVASARALKGGRCRICREAEARAEGRAHAKRAVQGLLDREDVLILDTETTGLRGAEVIEVALINTRGETLLDTLVCPRVSRMNPFAERVHGISLEMLAGHPTWPDVLPELTRLTERATVLAWNAPFDAQMLHNSSAVWGLPHPRILFACAMRLYAKANGQRSYGLHKAVREEGLGHLLERHASHRALGDVTFVLAVLKALSLRGALS